MTSSGGIITNCVRCALNVNYKMVKQLKMLKTSVKFLCWFGAVLVFGTKPAQEFYRFGAKNQQHSTKTAQEFYRFGAKNQQHSTKTAQEFYRFGAKTQQHSTKTAQEFYRFVAKNQQHITKPTQEFYRSS
jgi:hypothetical protein